MTPRCFSLSTRVSFSEFIIKSERSFLRVMVSTLHFGTLKRMLFCKLQEFRWVNDCCKHFQSLLEV